jgi:SAM-dependent methyltransferase
MKPVYPDLLACPVTSGELLETGSGVLGATGGPQYRTVDGVNCFLGAPTADEAPKDDPSRSVRDFYQGDGWDVGQDGLYRDSRAFLDARPIAREFSAHCMKRLGRYFAGGGKYILDAGSGPIPHDELLPFSDAFEKRICVDLSLQGLQAARRKLGDRGIYLQADITSMPLRDNSVDAITCNHVIYQVPAEIQKDAFMELWRVLKPGGVAVIVYWWPSPTLPRHLGRAAKLMKLLTGMRGVPPRPGVSWPELYHHPFAPDWLKAQDWPFTYKLDAFRIVNDNFVRDHLSDDWRGRLFINAIKTMQSIAPEYCGRNGQMPAIIVRKESQAN